VGYTPLAGPLRAPLRALVLRGHNGLKGSGRHRVLSDGCHYHVHQILHTPQQDKHSELVSVCCMEVRYEVTWKAIFLILFHGHEGGSMGMKEGP